MRLWSLALALLLVGCGRTPTANGTELRRQGRFGSLRDFVLFERSPADGGSFFLDRFETTRDDWAGFAGAPDGADADGALPQLGVDLQQARAFAHWRFSRLPRQDEWQFAATGGGSDLFPWGTVWRSACANSLDLQLGEPTPVGTFESGRKGDGPYDLIGNASEWTETVPGAFLAPAGADGSWLSQIADLDLMLWKLQRTPGLMVWLRPWSPAPALWLVASVDARVPRLAVGADYLTSMGQKPPPAAQLQVARSPTDVDPALGLRLATDPVAVLRALCDYPEPLTADEAALVRDFATRDRHLSVLAAAFARVEGQCPAAALGHETLALLRAELGR